MISAFVYRMPTLSLQGALLIAFTLIITGCDTTEPDEITTCEDLNGSFFATDLSFEAIDDPDLVHDFEGSTFQINFSGDLFTTSFVDPDGETIAVNGTYAVEGGGQNIPSEIILGTEPILPNIQEGDQRFSCALEGDGFVLETIDLDYDFDEDGTFEEAQFDASFEPAE